jgi:hypothetical protein
MEFKDEQLRAVQDAVSELLAPWNALRSMPALDVSKPNFHDSKAEFLRELEAVETVIGSLETALDALIPEDRKTDEGMNQMVWGILDAVDASARRTITVASPNTITDMIRKNKADTGYYIHALWTLVDFKEFLEDRRNELKDQERQYWSQKHRSPKHYPRAIALRLARLYAREKGERPTFGTARDGGHPSTNYGRALEKIFAALGIKNGVRRPAEWALAQLTDDDLRPTPVTGLLGGLLGHGVRPSLLGGSFGDGLRETQALPGSPVNALADIAWALSKGRAE